MKKINWGIIGLGNIAQIFSEGFFHTNNSKLLAISSHSNEKLEKFKKKFDIENIYTFKNYEELIECKNLDIIYIALPNSLHYEWVTKAIEKNKNILVEKPAVLNLNSAKIIRKEILKKNLFFTEGYMYRYFPQIKKIIEIIDSGEMGRPISMETSFGLNLLTKKKFIFFNKSKKIDPSNRLFNKDLGGGCILDLGCYPTSFSLLIASLIKNFNYKKFKIVDIKKKIGSMGVDIDAECKLLFEDGFTSKIKASFEKNIGKKSIINCEKGRLEINNTWLNPEKIIKVVNGNTDIIEQKMTKNIYSYQIENVSKSIIENKKQILFPGIEIKDTLLNTEILEKWLNA
jgi:predicted dehydrogenase